MGACRGHCGDLLCGHGNLWWRSLCYDNDFVPAIFLMEGGISQLATSPSPSERTVAVGRGDGKTHSHFFF